MVGVNSHVEVPDCLVLVFFFFSSRRRHTRFDCDWSSDVCSSDLLTVTLALPASARPGVYQVKAAAGANRERSEGSLAINDYPHIRARGVTHASVAQGRAARIALPNWRASATCGGRPTACRRPSATPASRPS